MKELILVGAGHSHVQVLRRQLMDPIPGVHVTVVVDTPIAVYSGMVPGVVAGQYAPHEAEIDVRPLARRSGATVVHARVTRIDAPGRTVHAEGRAPLRYDLASVNVGSSVAGLETPGVREHALATRPIGRFVGRVDEALARARAGKRRTRVVVVGGGAAGCELAFAVEARLGRDGASVTLLDAADRLLKGSGASARVLAACQRRGIAVILGARVSSVTAGQVTLEGREPIEHDLVLWAAGAAPPALPRESGLPLDPRGYVIVRPTLQVRGQDDLFAAGDCAVLEDWPEIPKAGVFAVREGPVLAANLRAFATGGALESYSAQRDFLALLNLGDGTAIGTKWGYSFEGAWVFRWKDRIDRRFMERFQVLAPDGAPASAFLRGLPPMPERPMLCGGCAAKVGETALHRALGRLAPQKDDSVVLGLEKPDDVAAVRRQGEVLVTSVDAFPAFTNDPWLVGRVAAVNALSDLDAKGVASRFALALVTVPRGSDEEETLFQVLAGARATLDPASVTLLGGHTTVGPELHVGFAVTGFAADEASLLRKGGVRAGDRLVLSRGLGTGVLFHADMKGRARGPWIDAALAGMSRGNRAAGLVAQRVLAHAATDVTGFGLAGHLGEMLRASGVSAEVRVGALPALPGVLELFSQGERSTFHAQNREARKGLRVSDEAARLVGFELLFDPQTAGGLLLGVSPERADEAVRLLREAGETEACVIGEVTPARSDGAAFAVV
jgi:selenide,water dikinase